MHKEPTRALLRPEAAAYIAKRTNQPMSPRTLERKPIPYRVIHGAAHYERADLDQYIEDVLTGWARIRVYDPATRRKAAHD